jgi:hypothetical protein
MRKPPDLKAFINPPHPAGADADRLWAMRGGEPATPQVVLSLPSIQRARERMAEESANRIIAERRERVTALLRRQELWEGYRRRRPLGSQPGPPGVA